MKQVKNDVSITRKLALAAALTCSSFAMVSSAAVHAADNAGLYLGANYGGYKARGGEFEDENDYFEALVGYKFNSFIAIEANYANFGEYGNDDASVEVDGWGGALVGFLPLSDNFQLYAKAGQFFSTVDVEIGDFSEDFEDEQIFYGVGVNFVVMDPLSISVEYDRYKIAIDDSDWPPEEIDGSDTDIDTIKVGAKFTF